MPKSKKTAVAGKNSATVGYEAQLWEMADALRGSMDAGIQLAPSAVVSGASPADHAGEGK